MSPEERQEFEEMKQMVRAMHRAEDVAFVESLNRRLDFFPGTPRLSDLSDVSGTDSATTGQVLKKTATTWQPGTDNTA